MPKKKPDEQDGIFAEKADFPQLKQRDPFGYDYGKKSVKPTPVEVVKEAP